jgi:hypothetical protein
VKEVLLSESLRSKLRHFHAWKARERKCPEADAPLFLAAKLRSRAHAFRLLEARVRPCSTA